MKNQISKKRNNIIVAVIGGICTIIAAILGNQYGINSQVEYIQSQVADIDGDGNTVNMNNVDDLISNYNDLVEDYEQLKDENKNYYSENEKYKEQTENAPTVELKNMGLCINGDDININKNDSCATINGVDYFSKEFIDNLVGDSISVTIKNDTMFLGKVVVEKEDLFYQPIIDNHGGNIIDNAIDSYGNSHTNVLQIGEGSSIIFNLNKKFSMLKFKVSIDKSSERGNKTKVIVSADDKKVKVIPELDKITTNELIFNDININYCTKLEISCVGGGVIYPLIYDAEVYN